MEVDDAYNNNKSELTPQQRKQCLKEFLTRLQEIGEEEKTNETIVKEVNEVLAEVNALEEKYPISDRVDNPDETFTDVMICKSISGLILKHVNAINISERPYQGTELASKLLEFIEDNENNEVVDFVKLEPFINNTECDVVQLTSLYGAIDMTEVPTPKPKEAREKKQAQENVTKKELIKVVDAEKQEEGIDDTLRFLMDVLKTEYENNDHEPIDYYKYIIDSSDFGETVQNMFYTSFLVRDGKARIDVGSNGKPTIVPVKSKELKEFRKKGGQNSQMITSIDMDFWETCGVKEGFLQKRKKERN